MTNWTLFSNPSDPEPSRGLGFDSIKIRDKNGKVISESRNLRGIRAYTSKRGIWVARVQLEEVAGPSGSHEGLLRVTYGPNGEYATAPFASFTVLKDWIARWRNAHGADLVVNGTNCGQVSARNPCLK